VFFNFYILKGNAADIGPMINEEAALKTEEWVEEAVENGARIVCGGKKKGQATFLSKVTCPLFSVYFIKDNKR